MTTGLLARADSPAALKSFSIEQLTQLAEQLRAEVLRVTAANGGHLATNLGNVELSIALHYVFDSPRDKIIWDVGNQCYVHKLITGRRDRFDTIRKPGGLSGFVRRGESDHDHLSAGHAGTALSAALGIAQGRDLLGDDYQVVAAVGDGAMGAGLSFEALNNLGAFDSQCLLVLNDNNFSISPSSGALSRTFSRAQANVLDGNVFGQLGIEYLGPVDGHDLRLLIDVLNDVSGIDRPVALHVTTIKGKGYEPAEKDPCRFHGVAPFDIRTGRPHAAGGSATYSDVFGRELMRIAEKDERVVALTAAMTSGTGLAEFAKRYPERIIDVGIAEQHAVTCAGGLALSGCRPVVAIYSTFLQRAYGQVIHDVCLQNLPVTFVLDRAGIVGADGPTHHGVFDLAFLRAVPNMVVMAPRDGDEFVRMLRAAIDHDGPSAVRIPRGAPPAAIDATDDGPLQIGRGQLLRDGGDIGFIAIGSMVERAMQASKELERRGISAAVVDARFAKPLDVELITKIARRVKRVITLEEHVRIGGFGSAVLEALAEHDVRTPVSVLGLPDRFMEHGSADVLLDDCGLSVPKIVARVLDEFDSDDQRTRTAIPTIDKSRLNEAIERIQRRDLPDGLAYWVQEYGKVGDRDSFLWKWCLEGVDLTTLSCVDANLRDESRVTKVLGVMFDVLLDDVADQSGHADYLRALLRIPFGAPPPEFSDLTPDQQAYAETTQRVWDAISARARAFPRYAEFSELLRFDYRQLLNAMRYSHMINNDPELVNMVEHDLYLPHNMHMMVSGTLDLMCSSGFDRGELGALREALSYAQCMGRIGNLVTTWERELKERDFTSGVFAFALREGIVTAREIIDGDPDKLRETIAGHDCETFFLNRWLDRRNRLAALAGSIRSVDINELVNGLERLLETHLGSRGLK